MTEKAKKKEIQDSVEQSRNESLNLKKHKHNSKRRKPRKNNSAHDLGSINIENVLKLLCNVLTVNDRTTSADENSLNKKVQEGSKREKHFNDFLNHSISPQSELNTLFKTLKLKNSKIKKTNKGIPLEENKPESPSTANSENVKKIRKAKVKKKKEESTMEILSKNCGNCNLNQTNVETSCAHSKNVGFMRLMPPPDMRELINCDNGSTAIHKNQKCSKDFSVVTKLENFHFNNFSNEITSQSVSVADKKIGKTGFFSKNKKQSKKKVEKIPQKESTDYLNAFYNSNEKPRSSSTCQNESGSPDRRVSAASNKSMGSKNKKKQSNFRSSNSLSKQGNEFPKYLSSEELSLMTSYGVVMIGTIRINQKNYNEAYISADKGMDILIQGIRDRNRALEGDEVYIVLKPTEFRRPDSDFSDFQRTAVVVGLKTINHSRGAIGTLSPVKHKKDNFVMFSPRDMRLPRLKIRKDHWPEGFAENSEEFKNLLFFARISSWNNLRFAEGELISKVGFIGDIEAETTALLLSHDLDTTPYSESLLRCLDPKLMSGITDENIVGREDFRNDCVFTIDPATAVDLDDAVSCKQLPNQNYEVGVHISDVSYYLKEGTALDLEVSKRATTVYLVQRAYHMLPFELCRTCSLTPGEDKLSFSVIWEITPDCEVIGHRFARTVIRSCGQFSYDQVQCILNGSPVVEDVKFPTIYGNHSMETIRKTVLFLHKLSVKLRAQRFENGALRIDQRKIKFRLSEMFLPVGFEVESHEESHRLIEELMLLANIAVAEKLSGTFPEIAFLRSHPPPIGYMMKKLRKNLEKYDIKLNISSAGAINDCLMKYSGDDGDLMAKNLVLNYLLAKPMTRAIYYCSGSFPHSEDRRHYALNVALYTHFTSPIRRYADIMVHRLLASVVTSSPPPNWTVKYVEGIANNCNRQKYAAKMAGEASLEMYFSVYLGFHKFMKFEAVVCDMKDRSFDCIILDTGAHQRVYFERINAEVSRTKDDGIPCLTVKWPVDSNHPEEIVQVIKMFTVVVLELKKGNSFKIEANLSREK